MTPKQKALQLVDIYFVLANGFLTFQQVKQCALIAVGELIANEHLEAGDSPYWIEVEKEIEKI